MLLSHALVRSTIAAGGLNYRVRDGNGCGHPDMVTGKKCAGRRNPARTWFVAASGKGRTDYFGNDLPEQPFDQSTPKALGRFERVESMWPSIRPLVPVS